jgi:hypothetical protein
MMARVDHGLTLQRIVHFPWTLPTDNPGSVPASTGDIHSRDPRLQVLIALAAGMGALPTQWSQPSNSDWNRGGTKMLFMTIFNYEPEMRNEVLKRRLEKGPLVPGGMKILGEWSAIAGGKVFRLVDVSDPAAAIAGFRAWTDLGKGEAIPVIETEALLKLALPAS